MTQERYDEISSNLDSSVAMMLNQIRRFMQANQASVMVGSGFSKNAIMDRGVQMKTWPELARDLYEYVYSKQPESKDLEFKSPVRLASQLAASQTHKELDEVIYKSLPDSCAKPGSLHYKLMQLPWHDVFTTNYDTILERTRDEWKQSYDVVTNKDTLLYSKSPRIIKLHGSFPDIRPFIMTEEDYRSYPNKYPEFVNTVRQAMIENLFCLIGFSGDDENFLSWIGWLRDVMGDSSVVCYLITYDQNKHSSEVDLMKERGIRILNLRDLTLKDEEGLVEAFEFFFQYIAPQDIKKEESWSAEMSMTPYEDLSSAIKVMQSIRESYPGWHFIPVEHMDEFDDIETDAAFIESKFTLLSDNEKYLFAKELCWRMRISYSPMVFEWLNNYIASLIDGKDEWDSDAYDMFLMLLSAYRKAGNKEEFLKLCNTIERIEQVGALEQTNRYKYEKALFYASQLSWDSINEIVRDWKVSDTDSVSALWKANILSFIGDLDGARVLLETAIKALEYQSRTMSTPSANIRMMEDVLTMSLSVISRKYDVQGENHNRLYRTCTEKLKLQLLGYIENGKSGKVVKHTFNIGRKTTSWHSGKSGIYRDYIYPYRYVTMREEMGYPFGLVSCSIDVDYLKTFLVPLSQYEVSYVVELLLRSMDIELTKTICTREFIHRVGNNQCAEIYESLRNTCDDSTNKVTQKLRNEVLIPMFSRFSVRLKQEDVYHIFNMIFNAYQDGSMRWDLFREPLLTLYASANEELKERMLIKALETSMPKRNLPYDFLLPNCQAKQIEIPNFGIDYIKSCIIEDGNNTRGALIRLRAVWDFLNEEQRNELSSVVRCWRIGKNDYVALRTYSIIPISDEERGDRDTLINSLLVNFENIKVDETETAIENTNIDDAFGNVVAVMSMLSISQIERVVARLCSILPIAYSCRTSTKWGHHFTNVDTFYNSFDYSFRSFVRQLPLKEIPSNLRLDLLGVVTQLDRSGTPLLEVQLRLKSPDFNTKKDLAILNNRITSKTEYEKEDGCNALIYVLPQIPDAIKSLRSLITFMKKTREECLIKYLQFLTCLVVKSGYEGYANEMLSLLKEMMKLYEDEDLKFETKIDICFYAGKLAGAMSMCPSLRDDKAIAAWSTFLENDQIDNDVKNGFEQGKLMASK